MKINLHRIFAILGFLFSLANASAGINWSKYDNGPEFFFGWEISFFFAIATIVLFGLSWILTDNFKGENGDIHGNLGCLIAIINVAMIICAICSFYLIVPLGMIYALLKRNKR